MVLGRSQLSSMHQSLNPRMMLILLIPFKRLRRFYPKEGNLNEKENTANDHKENKSEKQENIDNIVPIGHTITNDANLCILKKVVSKEKENVGNSKKI